MAAQAGATYAYYEFAQPVSDRLTDEAWRAMLDGGSAPDRAAWRGRSSQVLHEARTPHEMKGGRRVDGRPRPSSRSQAATTSRFSSTGTGVCACAAGE